MMAELTPFESDVRRGVYGEIWTTLVEPEGLRELGPWPADAGMRQRLQTLRAAELSDDPRVAEALLSALWLYHGFLDESHTISQSIPSRLGSHLHGIMHRLEGDYGNAKYWYQRARDSRALEFLSGRYGKICEEFSSAPSAKRWMAVSVWDPFLFVDQVSAAMGKRNEEEKLCLALQKAEWWAVVETLLVSE